MLALLLILAAPSLAAVGPSREPLPAREVERALVLPKGWTQLEVSVGRKGADARWSERGEAVALDEVYTVLTERVGLRHGVAPGHELWVSVPWHQASLTGPDRSAREGGLGDVGFGWRTSLLRREPPSTSVALELEWEAASADPGPDLPLGAGTPELRVGVAGRRQVGGLALTARIDLVHRFAASVDWLSTGREPPVVLAPGDGVVGALEALLQAGPLMLAVAPRVTRRAVARTGPDRRDLRPVADTDATAIDLRLAIGLALTRAVELTLVHDRPLLGEDFAFPYVEELNPTLGATTGLEAVVRF